MLCVRLRVPAGVLQMARYFGYYPGAEAEGQPGAALTGANLEDFKARFR